MGYTTLVGGLELVLPDIGEENWGGVVKASTWKKINDHTHSGGGDGNPLPTAAIANNAITQDKLTKNLGLNYQDVAAAGTTLTINLNLGQKVYIDLSAATGDVTFTINNPIKG